MFPGSALRFWSCFAILSLTAFLFACGGVSTHNSKPGAPVQLTVATTGTGTVTSSPAGINCGSTCTANFASGTSVTLSAAAGSGFSFAGWSGACSGTSTTCTLVVSDNTSVAAGFSNHGQIPLTVVENPAGSGTVTSKPKGINCGNTCSANFNPGTTITLTAKPNSNVKFLGWSSANCPGTGTCTITLNAATSITANFSGSGSVQSINHIIFLANENRSFDHIFGKLNDYRSAAPFNLPREINGLPDDCNPNNSDWTVPCSAMNKSPNALGVPTTPIYAFHLKTACIDGLSPDWISAHWDFNAENPSSDTPAMDGFVISAASAALANNELDIAGIRAMGFYTASDLPYHYWLATEFAASDTWFSASPTRTQSNRYYLMAGTSGGYTYPVQPTEPLIKAKTIFDSLQAAGISWKIYTQMINGFTYADDFAGFQSRYSGTGHIVNDPSFSQFIADAQSGNLPAVTFIEKPDADEKPGSMDNIQSGVAESRRLIDAVMYGPSWKDSVIVFTFDEFGGLFDHVPPPTGVPSPDGIQPVDICTSATDPRCALALLTHSVPPYDPPGDFTRYGFRVPLVVISPFTKAGYVSHVTTDSTSWLKLVEKRFNLQPLTARDGWSNTSDMSDFFDFQNPPFMSPPQNPPMDSGGACYDSLP